MFNQVVADGVNWFRRDKMSARLRKLNRFTQAGVRYELNNTMADVPLSEYVATAEHAIANGRKH